MQALLPLGNDVVDLKLTDNKNSAANPRFVERILARREHRAVSAATNGHLACWAYWAAKEAAYKALRKTTTDLAFAHRKFFVEPTSAAAFDAGKGTASGTVRHGACDVAVTWDWCEDWVHCVTDGGSVYRVSTLPRLQRMPSFAVLKTQDSLPDASVAARVLALTLLEPFGIDQARIVRQPAGRRLGPPRVAKGTVVDDTIDISLSHDGRFVAAAVRAGLPLISDDGAR